MEMVKLLLGKGANACATDKVPDFYIVLSHFCYKNCTNLLYFVAQRGETVFMIAALAGASKETMQLLLDSNCDIDDLDGDDKSVRDLCKAAGTYYNITIAL
jgi:hypothetical protein